MTIQEIHQEVKVALDKVESLQLPDLLPEEIDIFLNRAQDVLVEQLFKKGEFDEIAELSTNTTLTLVPESSLNYGTKAYKTEISALTDYTFHQSSMIKHTRTAYPVIAAKEFINTEYMQERDVWHYRSDLYNHPTFKHPKVFQKGVFLIVVCDYYSTLGTATGEFSLNYIKAPRRFNYSGTVNTDLNENLHRKIIDLAVQFMLDPLENPRLQANTELLKEKM